MGRLFGTDGARGIAVTELSCELAMKIGRAAAAVLTKQKENNDVSKKPRILIGKDTRISSDVLEAALVAGITSVGCDAELAGVVPTPAVSYLVGKYNADAGIMISASHNPVEYNGIKLFAGTGFKLPDETENEIEELVLDRPNEIKLKDGRDIGRIRTISKAADDYVDYIKNNVNAKLDGLKVLIDCANGSACSTAHSIFTAFGAECDFIHDKPDGININKNCGSMFVENNTEAVKNGNYDIALAFDGDADRCLALDENGNYIDGDKMIAIFSKSMKEEGKLSGNTAVVTVMSNLGFHTFMKENGIKTSCTKVGDRYVLEEMLEKGYSIGGEQSGHIIFSDCAKTGDGQLTGVRLLKLLKTSGKKLSELVSDIKDFPQENASVIITETQKTSWEQNKAIIEIIEKAKAALGDDGRVLVRVSGTEPIIRVMTEGRDAAEVKHWTEKISETIKNSL